MISNLYKSKVRFYFFIILFLSLAVVKGRGQGISNHWLLGYGSITGYPWGISHFDFNNGAPTIYYDSLGMEFNHTESTIADSTGALLFYTNGYYIADVTGDTMQNGSGLSPGIYAQAFSDGFLIQQGTLIIPKPGFTNIYYLFHTTCDLFLIVPNNGSSLHFYVTTIDMNLHGGLGGVITGQKNVSLLNDSLNNGKITACKHGNGRDWWIVTHKLNTDIYYKFLITPYGIQGPYSQQVGDIHVDDTGQAKFSSDGSKYAYYDWRNKLEIFDFDRCTGMFNNPIVGMVDTVIGGNDGVEFSPNSQLLYVSNGYYVYQYDLIAANVLASQTLIATWDTFVSPITNAVISLRLQQLGHDGKIYITSGNSSEYMHIVNYPDSLGTACNLVQHGLLLPSIYFNTLPNHPNYFLGRLIGSTCDTVWQGIEESEHDFHFRVYPNPIVNNSLHIGYLLPQSKSGVFLIYDVTGKIVFKYNLPQWSNEQVFNLPKLSDGVYQCIIKSNNFIATKKLIMIDDE